MLAGLVAFSGAATADGVLQEDLIAPTLCVGDDCTAGEASDSEVRLQAGIVRVRWIDSTASNSTEDGGLGASWSLIANDYGAAQDARSYLGLSARSIDPTPDDGGNNIVARHLLRLGPSGGNATAIGGDSELVDGQVSIGNEYVQRRLVNVANAIEATDVLVRRQLDEGLLAPVGELSARLNALETEIASLERQVENDADPGGDNDEGGAGGLGVSVLALLGALVVSVRRLQRSRGVQR